MPLFHHLVIKIAYLKIDFESSNQIRRYAEMIASFFVTIVIGSRTQQGINKLVREGMKIRFIQGRLVGLNLVDVNRCVKNHYKADLFEHKLFL